MTSKAQIGCKWVCKVIGKTLLDQNFVCYKHVTMNVGQKVAERPYHSIGSAKAW